MLARTAARALVAAPAPSAVGRRVSVLSGHVSAAQRVAAAPPRAARALRLVRVRHATARALSRMRREHHAPGCFGMCDGHQQPNVVAPCFFASSRAAARPPALGAPPPACAQTSAAADAKPGMAAQAESKSNRGHQAAPGAAAAPPPDPSVVKLREHQSAAARQPFAEECRTLLALSRYGVLSTLTVSGDAVGFPSGSIVGYADDANTGAPLFVFSTMSGHTRDVMADGRASLTVTAPGFEGAADARVCLTGTVRRVPDAEVPDARARYLQKHADAFWVDFGACVTPAQRNVRARMHAL
jgi:hypothetical protein